MQYLYDAGDEVVFMDEETYEQLSLPRATVEDELPFMQPPPRCRCCSSASAPRASSCPRRSCSRSTDTEPGVKGDTVSNVTKPATLETGRSRPGAAVRERRRQDQGRPAREALHQSRLAGLAVVGAGRRAQVSDETLAGLKLDPWPGRGKQRRPRQRVTSRRSVSTRSSRRCPPSPLRSVAVPRLVDTSIRVLSQEPLAAAMPTAELLRLAEILDGAGYAYLEVSGGGAFDAAVRRGRREPVGADPRDQGAHDRRR